MKKLVIFGSGKIAEVLSFYFNKKNDYEVVAFCEESKYLKKTEFCSLPVVALEEIVDTYPPSNFCFFVALGYKSHNKIRESRFKLLKSFGYNFANYISKNASYYSSPIGENCFIFENNVIQPYTEIGDNNIIWSGNHIGHHSRIGNNCFISSQVVISGNCTIEDNCFLGVNSTISDGICIGKRSVIGAGAIVLKNVPPNSLVMPEKSRVIELNREIL